MSCKICNEPTRALGSNTVLGRHVARYERCDGCGFVAVVNADWLEDAYSDAIADVDLGPINRMIDCALSTKAVLHAVLRPDGRYLDYGAGYGAFVRRMRDLGYDFHWYDKHCDNLFAKGFVGSLTEAYSMITAFEVFEHLPDPLAEIEQMLKLSRNIYFSTQLIDQRPPPLDVWSYYAPETGQHISFYTRESLERVARRFGLFYSTNNGDLHLLSERPVSQRRFQFVVRPKVTRLIHLMVHRPTLLYSDFDEGRRRALELQGRL